MEETLARIDALKARKLSLIYASASG